MAKGDRIEEVLARWERRYRNAYDNGTAEESLTVALDWLRAGCKLIDRDLDHDDTGWSGEYLVRAQVLIATVAAEMNSAIRDEAGKQGLLPKPPRHP